MLTVEICKGEKFSIEEDTSEVAYDLLRIVRLLQWNLRPQRRYDEIDVTNMYNSIIIAVNIGAYFKAIAIVKFGNVIVFVELMVAHANYHLLIVLRGPIPERMLRIILVSQVSDVSSQNENISCYLQWVLFQISPVVGKLQMEV